ncbi:MAG: molecular chaperone DnaJ [Candidatus Bipolaricaulaceae bacterium]
MPKDYYELLGVSRDASQEEIKRAYRRLAKQYHPDKFKGDKGEAERRFREITEAYEILSDPDKRAQYDRFGHAGPAQGFDFGPTDFRRARQAFDESFGPSSFDDIFNLFFGGGMRTRASRARTDRARRGEDLEYRIRVSLEDAAFGARVKATVPRHVQCDRCQGTGQEPGSGVRTCPTCKGSGRIEYRQLSMLGSFVNVRTCPECEGVGEVSEHPCRKCRGTGRTKEKSELSIEIPPGIEDGARLRLRGQGNAGLTGGPPGDLYIVVEIRNHPLFTRQGADLSVELPVHYGQLVLGGRVQVPTLEGREEVEIPPGTSPAEVIRLTGRGMPQGRQRGDLLIRFSVAVPRRLTRKQRELLETFTASLPPPEACR